MGITQVIRTVRVLLKVLRSILIYARKNGVYGYCGITYGTTLINDNYVGSFTDINALSGTNDYYVFPFVTDYGGTMYPGSVSVMVSAAGVCTAVQDLVLTEQLGSIRLD